MNEEEKRLEVKKIDFIAGFKSLCFKSRYSLRLEEIVLISKDKYDPSEPVLPVHENSISEIIFDLTKLKLQLFTSKKLNIQPELIMMLVSEGLRLKMY